MVTSIYVLLFCSLWLYVFFYLMWSHGRIPRFHDHRSPQPAEWPRLSIIIPACNEAEHIEAAAQTLLSQDYPDLELILVNDRSSDHTGAIIDRLAATDPRITPIHITELPDGWLGKVHALHTGVQQASGEWLLFTDADIYFKPGLLRRAVAYVLDGQIEHLALLPQVILSGFWLEVAVRTFGLLFLVTTRAALVNRPDSDAYIGVGAFNLVKRSRFEQTEGFAWLRMEVGDDVGVGLLMKSSGARSRFAMAERDIHVPWYPGMGAMFKGLEKNLFGPGAHYQWWRLLLMVGSIWALIAAPWVALFTAPSLLWLMGAAVLLVHVLYAVFFIKEKQRETWSLLLFPVGTFLLSFMMLRSGYFCLKNRGIDWRGSHYDLEQLKKGQRVKL